MSAADSGGEYFSIVVLFSGAAAIIDGSTISVVSVMFLSESVVLKATSEGGSVVSANGVAVVL